MYVLCLIKLSSKGIELFEASSKKMIANKECRQDKAHLVFLCPNLESGIIVNFYLFSPQLFLVFCLVTTHHRPQKNN